VKETEEAIGRVDQALTRDTIEICFCCLFSSYVFMSFLQPLGFVLQTANSRRTFSADIRSNDGSFLARRISWAPKQMVRNQLVELCEQHAKSSMKSASMRDMIGLRRPHDTSPEPKERVADEAEALTEQLDDEVETSADPKQWEKASSPVFRRCSRLTRAR
jgi:hypothetical protein